MRDPHMASHADATRGPADAGAGLQPAEEPAGLARRGGQGGWHCGCVNQPHMAAHPQGLVGRSVHCAYSEGNAFPNIKAALRGCWAKKTTVAKTAHVALQGPRVRRSDASQPDAPCSSRPRTAVFQYNWGFPFYCLCMRALQGRVVGRGRLTHPAVPPA